MKAFFISDRSDRQTLERFKLVTKSFNDLGVTIDESQLKRTPEEDSANFEEAYKQNMKSLKNADVLVAEVTNLSSGIGFLISAALSQKKPVLTLFHKGSQKRPSTMLKGSSSNKLMFFREYDDTDISNITKSFLSNTKSILDTKFIMIISPEIDKYLEWAGDYKRMHKAQLVRNAIEEYMETDKDWQEFQAE